MRAVWRRNTTTKELLSKQLLYSARCSSPRKALSPRHSASSLLFSTPVASSTSRSLSSLVVDQSRHHDVVVHQRLLVVQRGEQQKKQQRQQKQKQYPHLQYRHCWRRMMGTWAKIGGPKRIRVITMDVTGTLVSFRGTLKEHYGGSALKAGIDAGNDVDFDIAFNKAYKEISQQYPCFGYYDQITAKEWWRKCVHRSFVLAGVTNMTQQQQEYIFQRIYSIFGSLQAYEIFEDAIPFLHWCNRNDIICGILSNADERYGDSILPMLGLVTGDELTFQCFSKDYGYEKPDARFYNATMETAQSFLNNPMLSDSSNGRRHGHKQESHVADPKSCGDDVDIVDPLLPSQILHIGNDYNKDFQGARRVGWHAVLLNRYNSEIPYRDEWRRRGATVFHDLMDVIEYLGRCKCKLG